MPTDRIATSLFLVATLNVACNASAFATKPVRAAHASASPKTQAQEPAICKSLMQNYEEASKQLALNEAEDSVDDSAPRATMRQAQNTNTLASAQMTMSMMNANGCKAPTFTPSASRYSSASLQCAVAKQRIRAQIAHDRLTDRYVSYDDPQECDVKTWMPN